MISKTGRNFTVLALSLAKMWMLKKVQFTNYYFVPISVFCLSTRQTLIHCKIFLKGPAPLAAVCPTHFHSITAHFNLRCLTFFVNICKIIRLSNQQLDPSVCTCFILWVSSFSRRTASGSQGQRAPLWQEWKCDDSLKIHKHTDLPEVLIHACSAALIFQDHFERLSVTWRSNILKYRWA